MNSNTLPFLLAQAPAPVEATAAAAQPAAPGAAPMGAPAPMAGGMGQFLPLILIFAILYFIMIRPAQRKEKERKKEISELRAGTKVLFAGGLIGTIVEVKDATFRVEVADGVVLEIARGAVQRSLQANESPAEPDAR
ncbi:MAG: preprotein translocase subunit YajC [Lentisphaerae bacterium]|nr:preprotein translocase subunit YajC [Lentisphaerota bacterium]